MGGNRPDPLCRKTIGTFGDRTCPELAVWIHCRNCPAYAATGRRLLDRPIPDGRREEWAARLADPKETDAVETLSVIIFRIRGELLALRTACFQEAAEIASPHSVPLRTHEAFRGIVNVNGELLLCMSAAALLGIDAEAAPAAERKVYARLVVIHREGQRFVFPVDEVLGVFHLPAGDIEEAPATVSKSALALTSGVFAWQGRKVGLIEEEQFFAALNRSLAA